jgi:hypothetical protein
VSQIQVNQINDASGGVLAPISSVMRNRIINGAMVISQRDGISSITPTVNTYTLDRFVVVMTQASKFSVQQNAGAVTPPVGFSNYLGITSTSAYSVTTNDTFLMAQSIEGFNVADLDWGTANAKTVTLSFWVRSSLTGTFGGALTNNAANRSYPFNYSVPVANTWTAVSVTIPGDTTGTWLTNNGTGISIRFGLGSGSTYTGTAGSWAAGNLVQPTGSVSVVGTSGATFYITGVQFERGTQATSFEYRQYGTELLLCQRYYQKFQGVGTDDNWASGVAFTATVGVCPFIWSPPLRASATVISSSGLFETVGSSTINAATLSFTDSTTFSTQMAATTTNLTPGGGCLQQQVLLLFQLVRSYKMYKLYKSPISTKIKTVIRLLDNAFIPFDPDNTDYANFKKDLADGAELQDAEGNVIDGIAYLKELA